jgi:predicted ATP-dependent protease
MSESQLNKEFSKRDVQRMRNILSGDTANKTRVQAGYEKENKVYVEGDVWEENGKTWTINNGLKQTITKHDKLRQIIVMPLKCPECERAMKVNDLNKKMWSIHNKCFDCVVEYETHLKATGNMKSMLKN